MREVSRTDWDKPGDRFNVYCWSWKPMVFVEHYSNGFVYSSALKEDGMLLSMDAPQLGLQFFQESHKALCWNPEGPLLFILYINDLPSTVCSTIKIFADGVAMYRSQAVHSTTNCDAFQQDMDSIAVWCSKWQMRLNVSKCDLLCISNKRSPTKPSYHINNYNLHWISSVNLKYLGVFLDNKLS